MAAKSRVTAMLMAVLAVSACGGGDNRLIQLQSPHEGPDEFAILPTRPLEMPANFAELPAPAPGAGNRVDPDPVGDAVVALGGRPGAGGGDAALVAAAGRHGIDPGVRGALASEDAAYRAKQSPRFLERLFGSSTYDRVYSDQIAGSYDELGRWRAAGAKTPSAPPQDSGKR